MNFWPAGEEVEHHLRQFEEPALDELMARASQRRREFHGDIISFSPKVFIPLTRLCRDACGYCAFAISPRAAGKPYMSAAEAVEIARRGAAVGCAEALFTLGELPEQRYRQAREELSRLGHATTVDYAVSVAEMVIAETGLLPHFNVGISEPQQLRRMRQASVSQGLMLESTSLRPLERDGPHFGSKGKHPQLRVDLIASAGELHIPFTTGLLVGIGEDRRDRIESLLVIRALQERYGHIQEVIVQNFQPKTGTRMAGHPPATTAELLWTIAAARLILPGGMNIQAPPNLSFGDFPLLLEAGINDWGGVSPVTPDHVNPEAPWPSVDTLRAATNAAGFSLAARLPVYPDIVKKADRWIDQALHAHVHAASDAQGFARWDDWAPGNAGVAGAAFAATNRSCRPARRRSLETILAKAERGERLDRQAVALLFEARDDDFVHVVASADALRAQVSGKVVRYVVNRNINYTNICKYHCSFCAFSKGKSHDHLRGRAYDLDLDEVSRRASEAWERGAVEVCMQGGIHPRYTGQTYLDLIATARRGAPSIHIHAFSPLEVSHGAATLGMSLRRFLDMLRDAGLGSLPGTAAEILDDEARKVLCPDKLSTARWLEVMETAHTAGLPTTSTIMFGHIDNYLQWADHLLALRDLQERTGGFTEFVPLPFVHMEAPLYLKGKARRGPTSREAVLMHAVARLVLHPLIPNIQASWVKLGAEGVSATLAAGANDLGGTLMNESISRAAGTQFGQELPPEAMDALVSRCDRIPRQRTTLYGRPAAAQTSRSYGAAALAPVINNAPKKITRARELL